MRIGCEDRNRLHPDDVAWVVEWQLAVAFAWIPLSEESPVFAEAGADQRAQIWSVMVRAGQRLVRIPLPLRDLARVVWWCRGAASYERLQRPPAPVRASLQAIRTALRAGLDALDPLRSMGYPRLPGSEGPL